MINYFIPFEKIGDFKFDSDIDMYKSQFNFIHTPIDVSTNWETYLLESEDLELYVELNRIVSIVCREECLYKGRNIIGMDIDQFIRFYEINPIGEIDKLYVSDKELQDVYEFDDIGLQVWCTSSIIRTVIASGKSDDADLHASEVKY